MTAVDVAAGKWFDRLGLPPSLSPGIDNPIIVSATIATTLATIDVPGAAASAMATPGSLRWWLRLRLRLDDNDGRR